MQQTTDDPNPWSWPTTTQPSPPPQPSPQSEARSSIGAYVFTALSKATEQMNVATNGMIREATQILTQRSPSSVSDTRMTYAMARADTARQSSILRKHRFGYLELHWGPNWTQKVANELHGESYRGIYAPDNVEATYGGLPDYYTCVNWRGHTFPECAGIGAIHVTKRYGTRKILDVCRLLHLPALRWCRVHPHAYRVTIDSRL